MAMPVISFLATACLLQLITSVHARHSGYIQPVTTINSRIYYPAYLNDNKIAIAAEIGVQRGRFSQYLLQYVKSITKYYIVDIWREQKFYDDGANFNNSIQEEFFQETLRRVNPYKEKVEVFRMYSTEAATKLRQSITDPATGKFEPILDFLYLDARHDYCGCLEDIVYWWPLLKPGGTMSGHDFMWHHHSEWNLCSNGTRIPGGVRAAVIDWAAEQDLQILVTQKDKYESWLIRKPVEKPDYKFYVKPIPQAAKAHDLGAAFQKSDPNFSIMVEINAGTGYFMQEMLNGWANCKTYYVVDTADPTLELSTKEAGVKSQLKSRMQNWATKTVYIQDSSLGASVAIAKNLSSITASSAESILDIVYIGGRRDHCTVANDIQIWWPLIKPGGILAGHGYHWLDSHYQKCTSEDGKEQIGGVRTAAMDFALLHDLQIVMMGNAADKTWWIRKPERLT